MDCDICQIRSSVGYCADCKALLCEVCGTPCKKCGKIVCAEHIQLTPHGRGLCGTCMAEREARHAARKGGGTSFEELDEDNEAAPKRKRTEEEEEELDGGAIGAYRPPSRWLYAGAFLLFGFSAVFVYRSVPELRKIMTWPGEAAAAKYRSNAPPVIQDTNRLRDTSNVTKLDSPYHAVLFVVTWGIALAYAAGALIIVYGTVREAYFSIRAYYDRKAFEK